MRALLNQLQHQPPSPADYVLGEAIGQRMLDRSYCEPEELCLPEVSRACVDRFENSYCRIINNLNQAQTGYYFMEFELQLVGQSLLTYRVLYRQGAARAVTLHEITGDQGVFTYLERPLLDSLYDLTNICGPALEPLAQWFNEEYHDFYRYRLIYPNGEQSLLLS
jgi:hypothetical protein